MSVLRDLLEQEFQSSDTSIVSCNFKGILQHLMDMISIDKLHIQDGKICSQISPSVLNTVINSCLRSVAMSFTGLITYAFVPSIH